MTSPSPDNTRHAVTYTLTTDGRRHTFDTDSTGRRFPALARAVRNMRNDGHTTNVHVTDLPAVPTVNLRKDSPRQRIHDGQAHGRRYDRQAAQLAAFGGDSLDLRDGPTWSISGYTRVDHTSPLMRVQARKAGA